MIPNIIHQYYPDSIIPNKIKKLMDKWKNMHPDWQYYLYSPQKLKELGMSSDINVAKFQILDKYGGFYIDFHFEPIKKLDNLLNDGEIILIGNEHPSLFKKINQDFFGGIKDHHIWKEAIENKKLIKYDTYIDDNLFISINECDYITECNLINCKYKYPDSFAIYHYLESSLSKKFFCYFKKYLLKILTLITFIFTFFWYKNVYKSIKETFNNN